MGQVDYKLENTLTWMKMKHQNLRDTAKEVLRGKFIALNGYTGKEERFQVNDLSFPLKELQKEKQIKGKATRKEIIKHQYNRKENTIKQATESKVILWNDK